MSGVAAAWAVEPEEVLADPVLEQRARDISQELRCLVCQNQSIDDSNAGLARDLRILVRERLVAGDSDQAVIAHIVARYGDFVLLRPPFKPTTYALWLGPAVIFLLAGVGIVVYFRRRRSVPVVRSPPLTDDEQARLQLLLEQDQAP
jgi:cytochrome c-type biogenesis protein CcmH